MDVDFDENSGAAGNSTKGEKAENFMNYCEMANVSDELSNMDMGLKLN